MKILGIYNSGTRDNAIMRLKRDEVYSFDIPFSAANVKWLTGVISNLSGTGRLRVTTYVSGRENKAIVLDPYGELDIQNQACDRLEIEGVAHAPSLFTYHLNAVATETDAETLAMISNSKLFVRIQSIQDILSQRAINTLYEYTRPAISGVVVPFGEQLVIRDIRATCSPAAFNDVGASGLEYIRFLYSFGRADAPTDPPFGEIILNREKLFGELVGDWAAPIRHIEDGAQTVFNIRSYWFNLGGVGTLNHSTEVSYGFI